MDKVQRDPLKVWSWRAEGWMPSPALDRQLSSKQELIEGMWVEWPETSSKVTVRKRIVDAGISSVPCLHLNASGINRYIRIFFSLGHLDDMSTGASFSISARTMNKPINGKMRIVQHSSDKGWVPVDDHTVSLPLSKLWTSTEGVLPVHDLQSRTALMWHCSEEEVSICFAFVSVTSAAFGGPYISVRPTSVMG